jgi:hypothetical protein
MLRVDSDVPLPAETARERYPFPVMRVGDSFLLPDAGTAKNARSAAWMYSKRHGVKFSCRRLENGWRIWRVA